MKNLNSRTIINQDLLTIVEFDFSKEKAKVKKEINWIFTFQKL
jgi:hypothetical protein